MLFEGPPPEHYQTNLVARAGGNRQHPALAAALEECFRQGETYEVSFAHGLTTMVLRALEERLQ